MSIYPNYYQSGYQPMSQPQQYQSQNFQATQYQIPQPIQQVAQQSQNSNSIIWVQGEAGAKSYLVAPGQTVWLMDSENLVFYIKSTDSSGMPLPLRIFDYTERNGNQSSPSANLNAKSVDMTNYITREEFEEKIAALAAQNKVSGRNKEDVNNG